MIKNLYAILDAKSDFMSPFVDDSDETAIRGFCYSVVNQPGIIGFSPSDFNLFQIGTFNTVSGEIKPVSPLRFVFAATNAFKKGASEDA